MPSTVCMVSAEGSDSAADNQVLTVCIMGIEQNKREPGNVLNVRCLIYNHIFSMYGLLRNMLFVLTAGCQNSGTQLLSKALRIMCLKSFSFDVNISEFAVIAIFSGENIRILCRWTSRRKTH